MDKTNSSWLKTFSIGFSIISVGITIAIIGYIVLTTKQNQPTNQQPTTTSPTIPQPSLILTPNPDLTSSWKTFTDNLGFNYNFQFLYPPDWNHYPGTDSPSLGVSNGKDSYFSLNIYQDPLCRRQKGYTLKHRTTWKQVEENYIQIADHTATLITGKAKHTGYSDERLNREFDYKVILLARNGLCYDLSTQTYTGATLQSKQYLDQILSTFRFVE